MTQVLTERPVSIDIAGVTLPGEIAIPTGATGIVIFAHGSGSSRLSPRNRFVAQALQHNGIGTLLFDLLTEEEDQYYARRFDIELLTSRLVGATDWVQKQPQMESLAIGYFGASTGSAAALRAAVEEDLIVRAIVSRGGRPDMVEEILPEVNAPTLLIVGGNDETVLALNRRAYDRLVTVKKLEVVPGASHLFEEPGALERVADLATNWFQQYLLMPAGGEGEMAA